MKIILLVLIIVLIGCVGHTPKFEKGDIFNESVPVAQLVEEKMKEMGSASETDYIPNGTISINDS